MKCECQNSLPDSNRAQSAGEELLPDLVSDDTSSGEEDSGAEDNWSDGGGADNAATAAHSITNTATTAHFDGGAHRADRLNQLLDNPHPSDRLKQLLEEPRITHPAEAKSASAEHTDKGANSAPTPTEDPEIIGNLDEVSTWWSMLWVLTAFCCSWFRVDEKPVGTEEEPQCCCTSRAVDEAERSNTAMPDEFSEGSADEEDSSEESNSSEEDISEEEREDGKRKERRSQRKLHNRRKSERRRRRGLARKETKEHQERCEQLKEGEIRDCYRDNELAAQVYRPTTRKWQQTRRNGSKHSRPSRWAGDCRRKIMRQPDVLWVDQRSQGQGLSLLIPLACIIQSGDTG